MDEPDEDARGLGAIEGNIDKEVANRLAKKGMRWSLDGADAIAKVLELRANEQLSQRIETRGGARNHRTHEVLSAADLAREKLKEDPEAWLEAHMPALYSSDSDKPWVRVLKGISRLPEAV